MAEVRTIADLRRDYYHPSSPDVLDQFPRWNAWTKRNAAGTFKIAPGPVTLGGVLISRGANDVQVILYNAPDVVGLTDAQIVASAGVTGTAKALDGFVNCPIACPSGLVVAIDQADAIVTVLYL
jgi:hypothetical protein